MKPTVGSSIFDIITVGMYSDPLMVVREYLQNASDSIDCATERGIIKEKEAQIDVFLQGAQRALHITDNGVGMSVEEAERILGSLGVSTKSPEFFRGYRGIGRLAGVGYCEQLKFVTKSYSSKWVIEATWDCDKARAIFAKPNKSLSLNRFLKGLFTIRKRRSNHSDPSHFMRVEMNGINRFHDDRLMTPSVLRDYISRIGPVPFDPTNFAFAGKINNFTNNFEGLREYKIHFNGAPLCKPHQNDFYGRAGISDKIRDIELFSWVNSNGDEFARGWLAVTGYKASLPPNTAMRGLLVRQGNILVGDEYFLADRYSERRFSTWHVGEIHVARGLLTNARRDGFEHTLLYETFLEKAALLCKDLSRRCRESSKSRSQVVLDKRYRNENILFYAGPKHKEQKPASMDNGKTLPLLTDILDRRTFVHRSTEDVLVGIAESIAANYKQHQRCEDLMASVFRPFVRKGIFKE